MTGGEILVQCLLRQGVKVIFGMPGNHLNPVYLELYKHREEIRFINTRHEGGASLMAEGYSRATGEVGVCMVSPGPGAANAYIGMLEAFNSCSSVLLITVQQEGCNVKKQYSKFLHGFDHINAFRPVVKWISAIEKAEEIPAHAAKIFEKLRSERPGPVLMEVSVSALCEEANVEIPQMVERIRPQGEPETVKMAGELVLKAVRPFILAGRGVFHSGATCELTEFAEFLGAPVATTIMGKGAISEYNSLSLGSFLNKHVIKMMLQSDLCIAVGTKFSQIDTNNWKMRFPMPLLHIESDKEEINKEYLAKVGIGADVKMVLKQLVSICREYEYKNRWDGRMADVQAKSANPEGSELVQAIRDVVDEDAILVNDVHCEGYYAKDIFKVHKPCSFLHSGISAGVGYALPAAIGAKVAFPDRQVIAFCGDGGFIMSSPELSTAIKYGINIIVVIVNDCSFTTIKRSTPEILHDYLGLDTYNPNISKFADAYGTKVFTVEEIKDFKTALLESLGCGYPVIIEVFKSCKRRKRFNGD